MRRGVGPVCIPLSAKPERKKPQAKRPAAFIGLLLSTYRPCRGQRERLRGARRRRLLHIPRFRLWRKLTYYATPALPTANASLALRRGPQVGSADKPERKKPQAKGPAAFIGLLLSTCRPCRGQRERLRGARACRPPGIRWSGPWRRRKRRSPERSGSPWRGR